MGVVGGEAEDRKTEKINDEENIPVTMAIPSHST